MVFVTVLTKNFLAQVRTLFSSIQAVYSSAKCMAILIDRIDGYFDPLNEPFEIVHIEELGIDDLNRFLFRYSTFERVNGCKPFALKYALNRYSNEEHFAYVDGDLFFPGSIDPLVAALDDNSIVLTPNDHLPFMLKDSRLEVSRLFTGSINGGFVGIRRSSEASAFLEWWQDKLWMHGRCALSEGEFVDQKWLNFASSLFSGVKVDRNPTLNVAPWNLGRRAVTFENMDERWKIDGKELVFFHFSTYRPTKEGNPPIAWPWKECGAELSDGYRMLRDRYHVQLMANGYHEISQWPNAFEYFEDGQKIPEMWHLFYRDFLMSQLPLEFNPYGGLPRSLCLEILKRVSWSPRNARQKLGYRLLLGLARRMY